MAPVRDTNRVEAFATSSVFQARHREDTYPIGRFIVARARRNGQDALFYEFSLEQHVPERHRLRSGCLDAREPSPIIP